MSAPSALHIPSEVFAQTERPARVRQALERARLSFVEHAAVFDNVGQRLRDRLDVVAATPTRILDLGCRNGYQLAGLAAQFPQASIVAVDPLAPAAQSVAQRWWARLRQRRAPVTRVTAELHDLPFDDGEFDLVISNLALPWCAEPPAVFREVSRVLVEQGAFFFSTAGPDTLHEYRALWAGIDGHAHSFGLVDMHDLGDAMLAAGFADPVLDRDDIIVDYPSLGALEGELRAVGAVNLARGRRRGLMAPSVRERLISMAETSARFPVTLELVQGHGWKVPPKPRAASHGIEQSIPLEQVLDKLKR